jgi:hypothetical protein
VKIAAESDAQADETGQRAAQWKSVRLHLCGRHLQWHNFLRRQMHNAILVLCHAFELGKRSCSPTSGSRLQNHSDSFIKNKHKPVLGQFLYHPFTKETPCHRELLPFAY